MRLESDQWTGTGVAIVFFLTVHVQFLDIDSFCDSVRWNYTTTIIVFRLLFFLRLKQVILDTCRNVSKS